MILSVGYFFLAINLEIVVGIPSWEILINKLMVGKVNEYIDIAYVEIFLAMTILAITDNTLAKKEYIIRLLIDFKKIFLMIFHLFLLLILWKSDKVYEQVFFNIYIYILEVSTFRKKIEEVLKI